MMNSNNSVSLDNLEQKWYEFSSIIYSEIKKLKDEKLKIDIDERNLETFIKLLDKSRNNIDFMLRHKKAFIEIDETLEQAFAAIEMFKNINALENSAVPQFIRQIFDSPKIKGVSQTIGLLEVKSDELASKIYRLEDLRTGRHFDDELIKEIAAKNGYDKLETRMVRMYVVKAASKKIDKIIQKEVKKEEPKQVEIPVEEPKVEITTIESQIEQEIDHIVEPIQVQEESIESLQVDEITVYDDDDLEAEYGHLLKQINNKSDRNIIKNSRRMLHPVSTHNKKTKVLSGYKRAGLEFKRANDRYSYLVNKYSVLLNKFSRSTLDDYREECYELEKKFDGNIEQELIRTYRIKKTLVLLTSMLHERRNIISALHTDYSKVNAKNIAGLRAAMARFEQIAESLKSLDAQIIELQADTFEEDVSFLMMQEDVKKQQVLAVKEREYDYLDEQKENMADTSTNEESNFEEAEEIISQRQEDKIVVVDKYMPLDNSAYFDAQQIRYMELNDKYGELIEKYNNILAKMKPHERTFYECYAGMKDSITFDETTLQYDSKEMAYAKVYITRINQLLDDAMEAANIISENVDSEREVIQLLEIILDEFDEVGEKLKQMDLKIGELGKDKITPSNAYFVVDEKGEMMLDDDNEFLSMYAKIADSEDVDNITKKKSLLLKEIPDTLGRIIYAQRMFKKTFAFVKVKTGEGATGEGILVIASSSATEGYDGIKEETRRVALKYADIIKQQIELIESRNPEYLSSQSKIRLDILKATGMGGKQ